MVCADAPGADLAARLARRIRKEGPLSVADFMAAALTDADAGYYTTRDPLGARGDFTTAPEISQVFGELIGAWCIDLWQRMGAPDPVILAELGPGRGTLLGDALRAARLVPAFLRALGLHLVEESPALRKQQEAALSAYAPTWHADESSLPPGPLILVANEFLDALPIRQFVREEDGWFERLVGLDADGTLAWTRAPSRSSDSAGDAAPGTVREICPAALALAQRLGARIARFGGAALFVDYGHSGGFGDTLQAVRG
ncbi:MAG TPA: SAM-dependent methyltransferase, partial [Stellaceae bacterium]|nr:SAM-dependent methyltransferase [Stellaceae bacterium]